MSSTGRESPDLSTAVSRLLVNTADAGPDDGVVESVLHELRQRLGLDVVFVAEFTGGRRVFRFVDRDENALPVQPGASHELEMSFCQRIVDGRLPELIPDVAALGPEVDLPPLPVRIGAHLGTPVVLRDGRVFGTLCCFSAKPRHDIGARDIEALHQVAQLVGRKLDVAAAKGLTDPPADWGREPRAAYKSEIWNLHGGWSLNRGAQRAWLDA